MWKLEILEIKKSKNSTMKHVMERMRRLRVEKRVRMVKSSRTMAMNQP